MHIFLKFIITYIVFEVLLTTWSAVFAVDGGLIYVTSYYDNRVMVIDTNTNTLVNPRLIVSNDTSAVAFAPIHPSR